MYILQNYSISVFAVVLIKVYRFQTGSKPHNPSCSKQALANAISKVCIHWLQVYMAQSLNHWAALTACRSELSVFNCIHSKIAGTVLSLSFHKLILVWGCFAVLCQWSGTQIVVQKTLFVARTLCKRTLLGDIPVIHIFSIIKQWIK